MTQIRKDFLLERYSIISELRGARPHHFHPVSREKKNQVCFFCPGNENLTPPTIDRFPKSGKWEIRVFRNKFPALKPPQGDHEIVVETNKHGSGVENLEPEKIVEVFRMYEKRRKALEKKYKYVSIFKNSGKGGGASLPHSHTQILAGPLVPTVTAQENEAAKRYYKKWHRCAWCDYIKKIDKKRIAIETKNIIAITADAPRFPYEVCLMPKKHRGNFSDLGPSEALDFCSALKKLLMKITSEVGDSYNFVVHHSQKGNGKWFHFHIEILPRDALHAGYELGEGVYMIQVSPETAAKFYRS